MGIRQRYRDWRQRRFGHIVLDDSGFAVLVGKAAIAQIEFVAIATIHAFKRDILYFDLMCLLIAGRNGQAVEVSEQMRGYAELQDRINALPQTRVAWILDVMFPAFEPCLTQIYPVESE